MSSTRPSLRPDHWHLAQRAERMNPSFIREILKVTERPGIISFAGGLPAPETFPVEAMKEACARVLTADGQAALQYAASEGYGPLREWVAARMQAQGMAVSAEQVLITTGSQQGLDLLAKVLLDKGSRVLVETPTYLGALQAFTPMEPVFEAVPGDDDGPDLDAMAQMLGVGQGQPESPDRRRLLTLDLDGDQPAQQPRFMYLIPNFQNPTGRVMGAAKRQALLALAVRAGLPLVEDNPYGELWFDQAPPPPLLAAHPEAGLYLGSFSKVLAPGLRLGYIIAPKDLYPKLLQAKQAADLHTPTFNQRLVAELIQGDFLDRHVPTIRARYKAQCAAMHGALSRHMAGLDVQWNQPTGGMFLWARLPEGVDTMALLPKAVDAGVAYVPGAAFYADSVDTRTMRLSFVTASEAQIDQGVAALARVLRDSLA
ncbi:2-aminoadipate aminotransferase [Comamonas serinivorans]|uniref:2-aminoadipate aminotransferase n=1 Tax=Comamonas serinivorans TaxID=1082851 RepID=A0A1Y0EKG8_9BURK|nr:PLP-dependent aminotransferase family protein [Comamonas serinivorans]ARU03859.1 2-aminoadipate aminotransferase [Comamonas serinivorans]